MRGRAVNETGIRNELKSWKECENYNEFVKKYQQFYV